MLSKLREKNELLLAKYLKNGDEKNVVKHRITKELLSYEDCFLRLSMEEAYSILKSLGVSNCKEAYIRLLSFK